MPLEAGVASDLVDQAHEIHGFAPERRRPCIETRELQHLVDEGVEPGCLGLDPLQRVSDIAAGLAAECNGNLHARQRRAQLVRDIPQ